MPNGTRWTPEGRAGGAHYRDSKGGHWAAAKGEIRAELFYPLREDFWPFDADGDGADEAPGSCVPWLAGLEVDGSPIDLVYTADWPDPQDVPSLEVGETLICIEAFFVLPRLGDF